MSANEHGEKPIHNQEELHRARRWTMICRHEEEIAELKRQVATLVELHREGK